MMNRRTFVGSISAALGYAAYPATLATKTIGRPLAPLAAPEREATLVRPTFSSIVAPGLITVFYEYLKDKPEYKDFLKQC